MQEMNSNEPGPEFEEWLRRNDPEPPQAGAEELAAHSPSGCALCAAEAAKELGITPGGCVLCSGGDMHEGGGMFWADDKWVCGRCCHQVAEYFKVRKRRGVRGSQLERAFEPIEDDEIPY